MGRHAIAAALLLQHATAQLPQLDLSALGTVALAGSFSGISFYDSTLAAANPNASSLIARDAAGNIRIVGTTNDGGNVHSTCQTSDGIVYVGGAFTALGGVTAANIAAFNGTAYQALAGGLDGPVNTLHCSQDILYAGGAFTSPVNASTTPGNIASWSYQSKSWQSLPFGGLNGPVHAITASQDSKSIFIAGSFSTSFSSLVNSTISTPNTTVPNSLGSSLIPISLNSSDLHASPTSSIDGFSSPQTIFCPAGDDGPSNSWLLADGQKGVFTATLPRPLVAGGIRLGNTFYQGRGTQAFRITSIPNDQVLTLTYRVDPANPESALRTCSDSCPLRHNASIPFEDFLFPPNITLTGIQLTILECFGQGGGLHLLQLLSDGSYAYADQAANGASTACTSGIGATQGTSTSSASGNWEAVSVNSGTVAGTTQPVLRATVPTDTSSADSPSITWTPFIALDGVYSIYLETPGCNFDGTCASRTSVDITVTAGGQSTTTTVSQKNALDASDLVYFGSLTAVAGVTVTLRLAANPPSVSGSFYTLIANKIILHAQSSDGYANSTLVKNGHSLFEYVLSDSGAFNDGVVTTAANAAVNATGFDAMGYGLPAGSIVTNLISSTTSDNSPIVFATGNFTYSANATTATNLMGFSKGQVVAVPALSGQIESLAVVDGYLYAGGSFGLSRWQFSPTQAAGWMALSGDSPSTVTSLSTIQAAGHSTVFIAGAGDTPIAIFDPTSSTFNKTASGYFKGNFTSLSSLPSDSSATAYIAGNVFALSSFAAPAGAKLASGKNGVNNLVPLGYSIDPPTTTNLSRRDAISTFARSLLSSLKPRQASTVPTSLPSVFASDTNAQVQSVAFWTNGSTEMMILGGRFSGSNGVSNLAAFDISSADSTQLVDLAGGVDGTVDALLVQDDMLWVGGNFTRDDGSVAIAAFDLKAMAWKAPLPALTAATGSQPLVNIITSRASQSSVIIVAGSFIAAGNLPCPGICSWNTERQQWISLGSGLQGIVGAIDFSGDNDQNLYAAGSFIVNNSPAYIAKWNFDESAWNVVGTSTDIPGPATAISVDSDDNIFLAGVSTSSTPYLSRWDGNSWTDITNGTLTGGTIVSQMLLVPVSNSNASNDILQSDRMLAVSGALTLNNNVGNVSTALYDGQQWHPYLVTAGAAGSGALASIFYSASSKSRFSSRHHLAVGLVILVAIAIALGIVFLLVLIALIIMLVSRKDDQPQYIEPQDNVTTMHRPTSLLQTLNLATAMIAAHQTAPGEKYGAAPFAGEKTEHDQSWEEEPEDVSRMASVRYSFAAEGEGELSISTKDHVEVVDDSNSLWWLVKKPDGQQGIVPSAFLLPFIN